MLLSCFLQGGPGCSSLFGLFYLNGPYQLQTDMTLRDNPGKWSRQYGMLFLDQPIGTGFSIAGALMLQRAQQQPPLLLSPVAPVGYRHLAIDVLWTSY
jgi:carboxypeptidase C (cathepsin A)